MQLILSEPQDYFLRSTKPRKLFLAGAGSGKSHGGGLMAADLIINAPAVRGFVGANTYQQLSRSTLDRMFKVWKELFGWEEGKQFYVDKIPPPSWPRFGAKMKSYANTVTFNNGGFVFTASLENYMAIDGSEFGWAILDETKDTAEEAVKEVISFRLRQPGLWVDETTNTIVTKRPLVSGRSYNPLAILTSPAKVEWLNDWFELSDHYEDIESTIMDKDRFYCLETPDTTVVISSTYHNAHNLPDGWVDNKVRELAASPELIKSNIYGSPVAKTGGEFIPTFERLEHVRPCTLTPGSAAHLSFDFNVVPYMTGLVAEVVVKDGKTTIKIVDEYTLASPRNNTEDVCQAFLKDYKTVADGVFIYGDPSGKNRQTVTKQHSNNYDVIEDILDRMLYNGSNRVQKRAPSIMDSRDFVRALFLGQKFPNIQIVIDPKCKMLIRDLEFAKEGKNGEMVKPVVKDKDTKQSYEKLGHCLDALRYFLVSLLTDIYRP